MDYIYNLCELFRATRVAEFSWSPRMLVISVVVKWLRWASSLEDLEVGFVSSACAAALGWHLVPVALWLQRECWVSGPCCGVLSWRTGKRRGGRLVFTAPVAAATSLRRLTRQLGLSSVFQWGALPPSLASQGKCSCASGESMGLWNQGYFFISSQWENVSFPSSPLKNLQTAIKSGS